MIDKRGKAAGLLKLKHWLKKERERLVFLYKCQFDLEWGIPPCPEWFDHYIDAFYHLAEGKNVFWFERGVFSLLALEKGAKGLELCCGDGFFSSHFYARRAQSILAVDFDPEAINHANAFNKVQNVTYLCADRRTQMPKGQFNNIIWDAAIEHFTELEIQTLMKTIKTRLTSDGILNGYTIVERADGVKSLSFHEYEFKSKEDLKRFFTPYFKNVLVFETLHEERHNLYFYASDGIIPFTPCWKHWTEGSS